MKKFLASFLILGASASGQQDPNTESHELELRSKIRGNRELIMGFQKGFYEEKDMEPIGEECLNYATIDNIMAFNDVI